MNERARIQKVLAAHGVGSRREIEAWIEAGRITVNRAVAKPGQAVGPRDDVRLDGRRLRLHRDPARLPQGVVYHRPAREGLRAAVTGGERSSLERLPRPSGGRWIPISPMGLGEGGLELFVNDGALAAALMGRAEQLSSEFSVRVRGEFDATAPQRLVESALADAESHGRIDAVREAGGEAANRWIQVATVGLRPRDLKRIFERCGFEANRILRTRFGPIAMDRALARGVSRRLTVGEMAALADAAGLKPPRRAATSAAAAGPSRRKRPRRATGSRKRDR